MLEQVIGLLGNRDFKDAIVIQGVAGAGKSAFTLRLCVELRRLGLRPIRIRMRHLLLDGRTSLFEDMGQAIAQNSGDQAFDKIAKNPQPVAADFDVSKLFDETVGFGDAEICPHVVIFDGWDEISVSASEGFRKRIDDTLYKIRRQIIDHGRNCIRVILTGRPSLDVQEVGFLLGETPVLTIRPLRSDQVEEFADLLLDHYVKTRNGDRCALKTRVYNLIEQVKANDSASSAGAEREGILGLPLLALLAIWLTLNDTAAAEVVGGDRTALYRRLVDMTCKYGGSVEKVGSAARFEGNELRDLLRCTAATMTMLGTENISYPELEHRLRNAGLESRDEAVRSAMRDNPIASLMISFFFSVSTREHGCEFVHKSFREYLFAEAVVDGLKHIADRPRDVTPRSPYWKDFPEGDPRRSTVQNLAPLLAAQWISGEVARHLTTLVAWEIRRAAAYGASSRPLPDEIPPISLDDWRSIRDTMVDLWDWWAEGVHLRPQPYHHPDNSALTYGDPYAVRLVKMLAPIDLARDQLPEPVRMVTIDAHLGDALFRINCALHFRINEVSGWLDRPRLPAAGFLPKLLWEGAEPARPRKYQTLIRQGDQSWVAFAPSSPDQSSHFMEYYCNRINAAGWRPEAFFPRGVDMSGIDLTGASLVCPASDDDSDAPMIARFSRIAHAKFIQVYLGEDSDFSFSAAMGFSFVASVAGDVSFAGADLEDAEFELSFLETPNFEGASLKNARFQEATLGDFVREQLGGARLENARLLREKQP